MEETLISFETAKLAKEKGFDIPVLYGVYGKKMKLTRNKNYNLTNWNAKTKQQIRSQATSVFNQSLLQKWLREKHKIDVVLVPERYSDGINYCVQAQKFDLKNGDLEQNFITKGTYWFNDNGEYPTYEEALEKGLQEALKLIK